MTDSEQPPSQEDSEKEQQKRVINDLFQGNTTLREGQKYNLLAMNWWRSWKNWSGFVSAGSWKSSYDYTPPSDRDKPRPGPIDNSVLLDESEGPDVVRKGKSDNYDFVIITPAVWDQLVQWFGGGPAIVRPCIKQSSYHQENLIVEVRKLKLKIIWSKKPKDCIERWFSKAASIGEFIEEMAKELPFDVKKIKVWDFHNARKLKVLDKMEKHMDEVQILDGQYMLIEEQNKNGRWPNDKIYKNWTQQNQSYYQRTPTPPGKTGLHNLGNTCFMNSGIQCLSATAPIVDYFLSDKYLAEINETNPLGMKGEFAREYANLLRELWSARSSVSTPREFKSIISKYAPQFTGYAQHDSHELLAFLLDGLHEDLNRIRQKPYVELKDSSGRPDEEVAREAWVGYKARNNSVIVDLFQGQLKSRLKCPVNGRVSNQFDPFMYLSAPIPVKSTRKVIVTYYPIDTSLPPRKYGITIEKASSVWDFKVAMGRLLKVPPQSLVVLDVYSQRFHREFKSHEEVADIKESDSVAVYEVAYSNEDLPKHLRVKAQEEQKDANVPLKIRVPIIVREEEESYSYSTRPAIGVPYVVSVDKDITYRQLYNEMFNYMKNRNHLKPVDNQQDEPRRDIFKIVIYSSWHSHSNYNHKSLDDDDKPLGLSDRETLACEFSRENRKKFYQDVVEEPIEIDSSAQSKIDTTAVKDTLSLLDCLKLFSTEEQLSANDAWYCAECKEFREAYKKFDIWMSPQLLVIHLKRFSQINRVWRERLDNLVDFPIDNLDLTEFVIGPKEHPPIYDLYAVSNHYGSMGGGHYTAFARHRDDNKWYRYDDSSVAEASPSEIVSRAAYVLFYKRKDVNWSAFDTSLDKASDSEEENVKSDDDDDDDDDANNDMIDDNNTTRIPYGPDNHSGAPHGNSASAPAATQPDDTTQTTASHTAQAEGQHMSVENTGGTDPS